MKIILAYLLAAVTLLSCETGENSQRIPEAPAGAHDSFVRTGEAHYDLEYRTREMNGEKIVLFISTAQNQFMLSQQTGQNDPVVTMGSLNTERGHKEDKDATVYILNDKQPGREIYFLRNTGSDERLLHLDADREQSGIVLYREEKNPVEPTR